MSPHALNQVDPPASLPIISLAPFVSPNPPRSSLISTAKEINAACRTHGFFYLTDHGIPQSALDHVLSLARQFFLHSTDEEKFAIKRREVLEGGDGARGYQRVGENVTGGKRDWHEAVDLYAPWGEGGARDVKEGERREGGVLQGENLWPGRPEELREVYEEYIERVKEVGTAAVRAMGMALMGFDDSGEYVGRLAGELSAEAGDAAGSVDVDTHCAVRLADGNYCRKNLACRKHGWSAKRAVLGRSKPFDQLLGKQQRTETSDHTNGDATSKAEVEDENVFFKNTRNSFWVMRMIGYPCLPQSSEAASGEDDQFSCGSHTDYGCLTLLLADPTPGALQVLSKSGNWITADPLPGAFVVNIGDMVERWSNGMWKSTVHRVIHRGQGYRVSVPFFFEPDFDAIVKPLESCVQRTGGKAKYEPVRYGEFLTKKIAGNF